MSEGTSEAKVDVVAEANRVLDIAFVRRDNSDKVAIIRRLLDALAQAQAASEVERLQVRLDIERNINRSVTRERGKLAAKLIALQDLPFSDNATEDTRLSTSIIFRLENQAAEIARLYGDGFPASGSKPADKMYAVAWESIDEIGRLQAKVRRLKDFIGDLRSGDSNG